MHQCNYCNQKYTRNYNLKVHIEKMHSEDNTNNQNNLALPPPSYASPPSTHEDNTNKMNNLYGWEYWRCRFI